MLVLVLAIVRLMLVVPLIPVHMVLGLRLVAAVQAVAFIPLRDTKAQSADILLIVTRFQYMGPAALPAEEEHKHAPIRFIPVGLLITVIHSPAETLHAIHNVVR